MKHSLSILLLSTLISFSLSAQDTTAISGTITIKKPDGLSPLVLDSFKYECGPGLGIIRRSQSTITSVTPDTARISTIEAPVFKGEGLTFEQFFTRRNYC